MLVGAINPVVEHMNSISWSKLRACGIALLRSNRGQERPFRMCERSNEIVSDLPHDDGANCRRSAWSVGARSREFPNCDRLGCPPAVPRQNLLLYRLVADDPISGEREPIQASTVITSPFICPFDSLDHQQT